MTGFRPAGLMVSKWWIRRALRPGGESPHQSKIYTESNQSDFSRIFGELISMQTLAIYRPLLARDRLREIKRNSCEASQRLRGIATRSKRDG
jgi:hypothetical protein